ncbi:DUF397 domain-containing protein [Micromonospora sp. HUAS LYJ1]|uniref:DUF397 domain-containing protein n=1 Tax=Micromonospora sp. HUAS LYJ1 TaxID=3061626 RepID=UPI0034A09959
MTPLPAGPAAGAGARRPASGTGSAAKDPDGPALTFAPTSWRAFVAGLADRD